MSLDLDWDLVCHLGNPESVLLLRQNRLDSQLIEVDEARNIFEWQMHHLKEFGKPATANVLEDQFDGLELEAPQTTPTDLVRRLRERYGRNESKDAIRRLSQKAVSAPTEVSLDLIQEGKRLSRLLSPQVANFTQDDHDRAMAQYDRLVLLGQGPSLGFQALDDYFYGQLGLTFMVGAPKSLKSWFTIKALYENIMLGRRCYHFSLELPPAESDMRLRCLAAQIPWWKYLKRALTREDRRRIAEFADILQQFGTYEIAKPPPGKRTVAHMIESARDAEADVIFIDQLQYVETRKQVMVGARNDTGDYFEICGDLRDESDHGPIWIVHQFNRSVMANTDEFPEMQQIKGSAAIEETATLALGLWASKAMKQNRLTRIGTLVSRNFPQSQWEVEIEFNTSCHLTLLGQV